MKSKNFLLLKNQHHPRTPTKSKLALQVEENLREKFGEQIKFYKHTSPEDRTTVYYVSTNTSKNRIAETNKQIYKFINSSKLPQPTYHEKFYEKNHFLYSGLAHFTREIRKLTALGETTKTQKEYVMVFFALNDKLAKLTSQGIIDRIRVDYSDIKQFTHNDDNKKIEPNYLKIIK